MEQYDVIVVGGGLAGWTAAATAVRSGASVAVVDRDGTGGRASTDQTGGYSFNRGAHALYIAGPGARILDELGVKARGGTPSTQGAKGRVGDRLELLPVGPVAVARTRLLSGRSKARFAALMGTLSRRDPAVVAHLTIDAFLDELDLPDDARAVVAAIIRLGSYVADHSVASADVAVTQLQLGAKGVRYLHGGWRQLVEGLRAAASAHGARPVGSVATSVFAEGGAVEIHTSDTTLTARQVVLATGNAATAAELLRRTPAEWRHLGPPAEASCLDVGLTTPHAPPLTLSIDEPLYFNSHEVAELAPDGGAVAHVMRYLGARDEWRAEDGRAKLEDHLWRAGVEPSTVREARYLHRMTVTSALPVPGSGGMAGRPSCTSTDDDRVTVAGDWVGPIGNLADASIASGAEAGRTAAARALRAAVR